MKKNIFKKMIVSILSLSLMFSFSAPVAAQSHAPNGSDIISKSFRWTGFSVRDDLHGGATTEWEQALIKEMDTAKAQALKDYKAGKITGSTKARRCRTTGAEVGQSDTPTEASLPGLDPQLGWGRQF